MLIYNVTSNVEESVHEEWLKWMTTEHIPQVLSTGKFEKATLTKVLIADEKGTVTYSVQYRVNSRETLNAYFKENAPKLRMDVLKKFADKVLSFRTELQIIDEYTVKFN